ncbi:hypothetical protein PIB30_021059 [Stylosanthes scabra]|uniref:Uncharacterized protein n=1 Tax=Stylosanthes scabra TaxID=79078 RepID=A0ABU6W6S3_9FABA|nr:hypothetical protein [Stylosanthes scabra]
MTSILSLFSSYNVAFCTSTPRPAGSPSSSVSSGSSGSYHRERERSPRTPLPPLAPAPAPGPMHPIQRTPMTDARRDDEPSVKTVDPETELEGDPEEPYLADHIPIGAPEAYYSDASYGSEEESASVGSGPSSHHSSGSSFW